MTVCFASTGSSSSMAGLTRATWRSPIAGTSGISTPECRPARASVSKNKPSCRHSTSASRVAMRPRWPESPSRIGLDYFTVDCAETKNGSLLIFEADNTAIVHDMDPPDIFPYKSPQMRKSIRCVRGHARSPRPAEPGARGVSETLREASAIRIERDARSQKLGRHPRPGSSHAR